MIKLTFLSLYIAKYAKQERSMKVKRLLVGFAKRLSALTMVGISLPTYCIGGEIVLTGVYNGKNLYIHNPVKGASTCISGIYLNDQPLPAPKSSAIEIDLSHLKLREKVELRIIHNEDCQPKVINPSAVAERENFQFRFSEVTAHTIEWVGRGEQKDSKYFVEVYRNNTWHTIATKQCDGTAGNHYYSVPVTHMGNNCLYRIKYYNSLTGESQYSNQLEFLPHAIKITKTQHPSGKIEFSQETEYQLLDQYFNIVLKGRGYTLDMSRLKEGEYRLVYDHQIEPLSKHQ